MMNTLGEDIDIRNDVPLYNMYKEGELVGQLTDISGHWRSDFVAFVLGCSFTFEEALMAEGIRLSISIQTPQSPCTKLPCKQGPLGRSKGQLLSLCDL